MCVLWHSCILETNRNNEPFVSTSENALADVLDTVDCSLRVPPFIGRSTSIQGKYIVRRGGFELGLIC